MAGVTKVLQALLIIFMATWLDPALKYRRLVPVLSKKNFTVKFDQSLGQGGWGQRKKHVLKANYIDFSHARNIVCASSGTRS